MSQYSLLVLKVPLNTQQTTNIYMQDALPVAQPTMSAHSREKSVIYLWCECDIRRPVPRLKTAIVSHHLAFLPTSLPPSPLYRMLRFRRRRRSPWKRSSMHIIQPSVCNNNNNNNNNTVRKALWQMMFLKSLRKEKIWALS